MSNQVIENIAPGLPVEVGTIGCELKKLWSESGGTKTRASLINLAVYSEEAGSLSQNTKVTPAGLSSLAQPPARKKIVYKPGLVLTAM